MCVGHTIYPTTWPPVLAVTNLPHGLPASCRKSALPRGLHTVGLLQPHASVGSGGRTPGQFLMNPPTQFSEFDSYIRDIGSRRGIMGTHVRGQEQSLESCKVPVAN